MSGNNTRYRSEADQPFLKSREWTERIRPRQLSRQPLCEHCALLGRIERATSVDHIRRPHGDRHLQRSYSNLQSLCDEHHATKSQWERRNDGSPLRIGIDPITGWSIELEHGAVNKPDDVPSYTLA